MSSSTPFPPGTKKIVSQLVVGGSQTPAQDLAQFMARSPNLLIGTPGRLLDLLNCQAVHCPQSSFEVLVLDEADRLLDLGFQDDLQKILKRLPKQRRTGLFSASISEAVDQIIRVGLRNPVRISVKVKSEFGTLDKRTPVSLQLSYAVLTPTHKLPALRQLLDRITPTPQKSIIYVSTCAAVDYFQHILPMLLPDFTVVPLHGKLTSKVRDRNFARFTESITPTVLLTTDVAARGLDIPMVDLVIQLDPPTDPKVFIHRCGRAGRAGRRGTAVIFLSPGSEENYISFLSVRKTPISRLEDPNLEVSADEATNTTKKIRDIVMTDRALHEKAQKAFVSWVQSYSKHQASSIFPVSQLDWEDLGNAWGLLRLPRMPEAKNWGGDRSLGVSADINTLKYKDAAREKRRLTESENKDVTQVKPKKVRTEAWSAKKEMKETREVRREKRRARREMDRKKKMTDGEIDEQMELEKMIAQVRSQNVSAEDEWEGFD
jgi:ATP-dependent RNA helicase DDX55/SPB4